MRELEQRVLNALVAEKMREDLEERQATEAAQLKRATAFNQFQDWLTEFLGVDNLALLGGKFDVRDDKDVYEGFRCVYTFEYAGVNLEARKYDSNTVRLWVPETVPVSHASLPRPREGAFDPKPLYLFLGKVQDAVAKQKLQSTEAEENIEHAALTGDVREPVEVEPLGPWVVLTADDGPSLERKLNKLLGWGFDVHEVFDSSGNYADYLQYTVVARRPTIVNQSVGYRTVCIRQEADWWLLDVLGVGVTERYPSLNELVAALQPTDHYGAGLGFKLGHDLGSLATAITETPEVFKDVREGLLASTDHVWAENVRTLGRKLIEWSEEL